MDAKTASSTSSSRAGQSDRPAIAVNESLSIEVTVDEILGDLLYPATRLGEAR